MKIHANISMSPGDVIGFTFPGGERQIRFDLPPGGGSIDATARLKSSDDIMDIMLLADAIDRTEDVKKNELYIPYFPYARQDRVCNKGEALSLHVMAKIVNGLGFERVRVLHPHSAVTEALTGCIAHYPYDEPLLDLFRRQVFLGNTTLVSPDAGAEKMVFKLGQLLQVPVVSAYKTRDTMTGAITGTRLAVESVKDMDCLIVDDICDGGRTFVELAKVLKDKGARRVRLYVTHGIFSNGLSVFQDLIDEVYYTNSLKGDIGKLGVWSTCIHREILS